MTRERSIKDVKINRITPKNNKKRLGNNQNKTINPKMENVVMKDFNSNNSGEEIKENINPLRNIDQSRDNLKRVERSAKKKDGKRRLLAGFGLLILLAFFLNYFLHSADITLEPRKADIVLDETVFVANKVVEDDKIISGEFYYSIEEKEIDQRKELLKIAAVQEVEESAEGKIEIKNDSDKKIQLIKTTRFELKGKIYRIQNTISVDAKSSKVVSVVADKPGEEYNNNQTGERYSVPGLEGTDSYKTVYGISQSQMSGGFSGQKPVANKDDLKEKEEEMQKDILAEINREISLVSKKSDNVVFKSISQKNIDLDVVKEGDELYLVSTASFATPYIKIENFDEVVVNKTIDGEYVEAFLEDRDNFTYGFIDAKNLDFKSGDSFKVKVSGEGKAIWIIDEEKIAKKSQGVKVEGFEEELLKDFPIEKADISIFPFWKGSFPSKVDKIEVTTK